MKEIKRFDLYFDEMRLSKIGFWCKHSDVEQLQARIKELESDKHINEIKVQGICWALERASFDCTVHDDPVSVLEKVEKYAEQLRNNNE